MKVLLVHNFYGSSAPSGENQVFEQERILLLKYGHEVKEFTRHSDEIRSQGLFGKIKGGLATPWNPWTSRAIRKLVESFRPDVVHAHNTFPLISPAIFHAVGNRAARVITLHNYRLFCSAGIPMREGHVCTDCMDKKSAWSAIKYSCYRNSRLATLPLAISVELHRRVGTWTKQVDAFIALSDFQRQLMIQSGLPTEKMYVKPNFYSGMPKVMVWHARKPVIVFVGRLSAEKGVKNLLRAWQMWGRNVPELCLIGDGPLKGELEKMSVGLPVRFLGQLNAVDAQAQIARAQLLILPSECFEGFPMVIREAFAFGTPTAVSEIGPLPVIVQNGINGVVFKPANPDSLLQEVRKAWGAPNLLERLGQGARKEFEQKYTEDVNYDILMQIYQQAIKLREAA